MRNAQPLEAEVWGSPDQSASSPSRGTGLEGPGKLGGRPPAPRKDEQSQQPLLLLSLLSLAPFPPISATSHSASAGSAPPAQTLQKQTAAGSPRGHRRSRRPGWGVPPPRMASTSSTEASRPHEGPTGCCPQEKSSVSRGRGCRGGAGWASLCSSPPGMELGGGFTRVRRGIWVSWAPAPPSGDLSLTRLPWPFPLPSLPTSRMNHWHPSPYLRAGFWGNASYGTQNDAPQYTHASIPRNM